MEASDEHWWFWKGSRTLPPEATQMAARARLIDMRARRVPVVERVFAGGSFPRPSFIPPHRCQNVLIEGVTIVNSPMRETHPVLCRNVTSGESRCSLPLRGSAHTPMRNIPVTDCVFDDAARDDVIEGVTGLTLSNVRVNGRTRNETISRLRKPGSGSRDSRFGTRDSEPEKCAGARALEPGR